MKFKGNLKRILSIILCFLLYFSSSYIQTPVNTKATTNWTFSYNGTTQSFTVPSDGEYTLEVYGAQGGSVTNYTGGKGGYSKGTVYLTKGTILYVIVGGAGSGATKSNVYVAGGYNGGGTVTANSTVNHICASGGGATHIATRNGTLQQLRSYQEDVIIVAGGGGGARDQSNHDRNARWGHGGDGGGLTGGGAISSNGSTTEFTTLAQNAGTQTTGYAFGMGQPSRGNSGGGGGWYGGYAGSGGSVYAGCGSGGSGYIDNLINATTSNGVQEGNGYAIITLSHECNFSIITTVLEPTCIQEGIIRHSCECGRYYDETTSIVDHSHPEHYSYDTTSHFKNCTICGVSLIDEPHTIQDRIITNATCQTLGVLQHYCSICNYSYNENIDTIDHILTDYQYNSNTHYKLCQMCGTMFEEETHTFEDTIISTSTCTTQGETSHKCITCGYTYSTFDDLLEHEYVDDYDEDEHFKVCSNCGLKENLAEHSFEHSISNENECLHTCSCGYFYTSNHTYTNETTNNITKYEGYSTTYCSLCNYELEKIPLEYDYVVHYVDEDNNDIIAPLTFMGTFNSTIDVEIIEIEKYESIDKNVQITIATHDNEVYIHYKKVVFNVNFMSDGEVVNTIEIHYGDKVSSFTPNEKENYTFVAWYSNPSFEQQYLWDFDVNVVSQDTTLYALWQEDCIFSIRIPKTLIINGSTGIASYAIDTNGHLPSTKAIAITSDTSFPMKQPLKQDVTAYIKQERTIVDSNFIGNQIIGYIYATINGEENGKNMLSAGSWNGSFNFYIRIQDY